GTRARANERTLQRFLAKPNVDILFASETTTHHYASLYTQLRNQGTPIPTNDLWIAALVVEHGLALVSSDSHFAHLPQLERVG
ncbi:MAG: PIN domain-containing protein, partial [Planctomycetes bacterium]|nr:PIN domain-containing protein [Planctomycetota bacterium]